MDKKIESMFNTGEFDLTGLLSEEEGITELMNGSSTWNSSEESKELLLAILKVMKEGIVLVRLASKHLEECYSSKYSECPICMSYVDRWRSIHSSFVCDRLPSFSTEGLAEQLAETDLTEQAHELNKDEEPTDDPLRCRCIRIGSFNVFPRESSPHKFLPVTLSENSMSFQAPTTDGTKFVLVKIFSHDITNMQVYFGYILPLMFVSTTQKFSETLRSKLGMTSDEGPFFDSNSKDEKIQMLTFLIEQITEDQKNFIKTSFPGDEKVNEINLSTANKILVRSSPETKFKESANLLKKQFELAVEIGKEQAKHGPPQELVKKIMQMDYSKQLAEMALKRNGNDVNKAMIFLQKKKFDLTMQLSKKPPNSG